MPFHNKGLKRLKLFDDAIVDPVFPSVPLLLLLSRRSRDSRTAAEAPTHTLHTSLTIFGFCSNRAHARDQVNELAGWTEESEESE